VIAQTKSCLCPLSSVSPNSVLTPFCIRFRSRPLATGHRVVYDNFSTHSKEIA
jgi:hypothetical protein